MVKCDYSCTKSKVLVMHKFRKHGKPEPQRKPCEPNHVFKLCNDTCLIKQVLTMHMHKEHNGAAPFHKSCNMCQFTSHLSDVLNNHIDRKNLCIKEFFSYVIGVIFLPRANMCLRITNILSTKKKPA